MAEVKASWPICTLHFGGICLAPQNLRAILQRQQIWSYEVICVPSSCVEEHKELELLAKEEGEEMKKLVEADLDRVRL